jgi:hypothetical protein
MAQRLISRAELARRAGVSKPAITKRCAKDFVPAMLGDKIDLDHPVVQSFLKDRGVSTPAPARAPTRSRKAASPAPAEPTDSLVDAQDGLPAPTGFRPDLPPDDPRRAFSPGSPEDLEYLGSLLEPLVAYFGTDEGCKNWMIALREKENIRAKRLDNEETEGLSIPREFVVVHILSLLEETNKRLLGDMPKTLVRRLFSLANTGATATDGEREAREAVSSHLDAVRQKIAKSIRDAARRAAGRRAGADRGTSDVARGADRVAHNKA